MKKLLMAGLIAATVLLASCESAQPWAIRDAAMEMGLGAIMESPVTQDIINHVPAPAET